MNLLIKYYDYESIGGGIPDEVRRKIEDKAMKESSSPSDYEWLQNYYSYGYSLASEKLKEKDEEISRLKADIELANSGRSEYFRMFNEGLHKIESLISENAKLKAENDRLRGALSEIVSPISYMQNRLKEGEQLNGIYAVKLADDANYLRGIAANAIDDQISQRDGMRMQINSLEDALMVKNSEVDALKAENERLRVLLTKLRNNYLYETDEEGTPKALLSEILDLWNDVNIELIPPPPKTKSK